MEAAAMVKAGNLDKIISKQLNCLYLFLSFESPQLLSGLKCLNALIQPFLK